MYLEMHVWIHLLGDLTNTIIRAEGAKLELVPHLVLDRQLRHYC